MRMVKLKEVLKHRKGFFTIDDTIEYKLCRVQLHRKGVVQRGIVSGSEIRTKKQQLCKSGDFIVAEMDAKFGGYGFISPELNGAIVSSHYFLFELDKERINQGYLEMLCQIGVLQSQIKAVGSTNYSAVRPSIIFEWEIPLPTLSRQQEIEILFKSANRGSESIKNELDTQLSLAKQLRQAFLREAMQGKLVPQKPADGHAKDLLAQIKAEKAKLGKKDKPLPPIKPEEIPFEIPEGWVWCRLGEVADVKIGSTPSRQMTSYWGGNIPWVSSGEVANNLIFDTKEKISEIGLNSTSLSILPRGSVLVAMIGQGKTRGQTSILNIDATTNQNVAGLIINDKYLLSEYIWYFFLSRYEITRGGATGGNQPALNGIKIKNTIFNLPPFSEQKRIVKRLIDLFDLIKQLESSIFEKQNETKQLLQQVLRETLMP